MMEESQISQIVLTDEGGIKLPSERKVSFNDTVDVHEFNVPRA